MTITTLLKEEIAGIIETELEAEFTHGAIGTGTTASSAGDTALESEEFRDAIDEFSNPGAGTITASLRVLSTEANGNAITEYGWFDAAASGNMWTRNVITSMNKTSDIQLFLNTSLTLTVEEI